MMRIQITQEGSLLPVLLDREITASEYAAITYILDQPDPRIVRAMSWPGSIESDIAAHPADAVFTEKEEA